MQERVTGVIKDESGKILITKKDENFWEFPSGKISIGETDEEALMRKMRENWNIEISINNYISENSIKSSDGPINMVAYEAFLEFGKIKSLKGQDYKWVEKEDLNKYKFRPANKFVLKAIEA